MLKMYIFVWVCIYMYIYIYIYTCIYIHALHAVVYLQIPYGVAMVSRIDQITGLIYRILYIESGSFAKEAYTLIDPTKRSHPIMSHTPGVCHAIWMYRCIGMSR